MTVNFNGRSYTQEVLETMGSDELLILHNKVASIRGGDESPAFDSRAQALKLTWEMLQLLDSVVLEFKPKPVEDPFGEAMAAAAVEKPKPIKASVPSKRIKRFKFPPTTSIKVPRDGSLRHQVLELLSRATGATYLEVIECVRAFDGARELAEKNVERRAYEVIRLLHYYNGYGLAHDGDAISIKA